MSKIGKKPIPIPPATKINVNNGQVSVKGPKSEQSLQLHPQVRVEVTGRELKITVVNPADRRQKALWGTFRALLNNIIIGVNVGFEKKLELVGVGYKAAVSGSKLILNLGFSHPVEIEIPKGLEVQVEKNLITVTGVDKQAVGELAAFIRSKKVPEPYKGKGIKYQDEIIRRKAGKVVKAVGA